jgi:hypothetical protein
MNRRDLIKTLALSSGALLFPVSLFPDEKKKPLFIIDIDSFWYPSFQLFCEETPHAACIQISNGQSASWKTSELFRPGRRYFIAADLIKPNAVLAGNMIRWLHSRQIEFCFFGTLPLFNSITGKWAGNYLSEFGGDPQVHIFDVNAYLNLTDKIQPGIMADKAFEKLEKEIYFSLKGLISRNPLNP